MTTDKGEKRLKVAIIGGGPGGLGAAIELAKLPYVDWKLYEKKLQISETGGGISVQPNTWRLLEHNGAAAHINAEDFFRPDDGLIEQRRNGRNGRLLVEKYNPDNILRHHQSGRMVRSKLQAAMLKEVDQTRVHVGKYLIGIEQLPYNRLRISFRDGFVDEVDLLVGADGIRSVIRESAFPNHTPRYTGQSVYRTIISKIQTRAISGIPWAPVFWKHIPGLWVFTCPLGNDDFEVTARIDRAREGEPVSWGRPFDLRALLHEYDDFCLPVRQILRLAAEQNSTQEFALFSGPRLPRVVSSHSNIALIGDAAHPLLGNFGVGAGFALEDVYALTRTISWAWSRDRPLADALNLFDAIRSPHYRRVYEELGRFDVIKSELPAQCLSLDEEIDEVVKRLSHASPSWMYDYDIDKAVGEALRGADRSGAGCGGIGGSLGRQLRLM